MVDKDLLTFLWQKFGYWINLLGTPLFLIAFLMIFGQINELKNIKSQVRSQLMCIYSDGKVSKCDFESLKGDEGPVISYIQNKQFEIAKALFSNPVDYVTVKAETSALYGYFRENSQGSNTYKSEVEKAQNRALTIATQFTADNHQAQQIKKLDKKTWGARLKGVVTENDEKAKKNTSYRITLDLIFVEATLSEEIKNEKVPFIINEMRVTYDKES